MTKPPIGTRWETGPYPPPMVEFVTKTKNDLYINFNESFILCSYKTQGDLQLNNDRRSTVTN